MIPFVEVKHPDYDWIREQLSASETAGVWSNFGQASQRLEAAIAELQELRGDRSVVSCANGTIALHALVSLYEHLAGRPLRWVVSSFTFHAQRQGPLGGALVVDCDDRGWLDLESVDRLPRDSYDGIVVTGLFGSAARYEEYEELAFRNGKIVLFDSATCLGARCGARPCGAFGAGEIFSFHHTKPCGFGEGGCVTLPVELVPAMRSLLNFGLYPGVDTGARSTNGKMSDVAAAFVLDRVRRVEEIGRDHSREFERISALAHRSGLTVLTNGDAGSFPNLVPVVFPLAVDAGRLSELPLTCRKYYRPLGDTPRAWDLYQRIVCFPCHGGLAGMGDAELCNTVESLKS